VRVKFSSATYYLLGHSAELMLKAFLFKHGQAITDLRKINHDLEKLASLARDKGLPEKVQLVHISHLASAYKDKSFEYRTRTKRTLPDLDLLIEEVKALQAAVFDKLWQ
jgi:HEPN domain-containing protein